MVQDRLRPTQSRQKAYTYCRLYALSFRDGEQVFFQVSILKGVMSFGRKSKLNHRCIGPFNILCTVGDMAYELSLLLYFFIFDPIFHVTMLRCYIPDESHIFW